MSLIKQLWIAVGLLMVLVFVTSFSISTYSASHYYAQQLRLKNIDNANSLALMMSQMEKDPVMIELLVAAQFDTGHYRRIALINPLEEPIVEKVYNGTDSSVIPAWFMRLTDLKVEPGVAQVQQGWHQFGVLYVESDERVAYESLWNTTLQFLMWFLAVTLVLGAIGTYVLKVITRPLDDVVVQAEAIGGRRFITSTEPKTLEFGRVVRAMNILSDRIRQMLEKETQRLEELRYKNQHDALTGFANRDHFTNLMEAKLAEDDQDSHHAILLIRVANLAEINQTLGHQVTDGLIKNLTTQFERLVVRQNDKFNEHFFGRLNGRDFALMFTDVTDLAGLANDLLAELSTLASNYAAQTPVNLPMAGCYFQAGDKRIGIMMKLDDLLAKAELQNTTCLELSLIQQPAAILYGGDDWRNKLTAALAENSLRSQLFPVVNMKHNMIHQEAMMRLHLDGQLHSAGYFIPWVRRLGMMAQFDLAMLKHALNLLANNSQQTDIAINISIESLRDPNVSMQIVSLLKQSVPTSASICLEFAERTVLEDLNLFRGFCAQIKPLGCKIGLDQAGAGFAQISNLQALGLDYLKVDAAFIRDLKTHSANYDFVRGLCTLAHSIGLQVIALGVSSLEELDLLNEVGIDGVTGQGIN